MTKGNGGIRKDAAVFSLLDRFPEDGVPVKCSLGEAGDLLAGLAEAEAALRQDAEMSAILTECSLSLCKACKEIPGFAQGTFDRDAIFREPVQK